MAVAPSLTRTRSVLTIAEKREGAAEVRFGSMVEGVGDRMEIDHNRPHILLDIDQWTDLGQPESITVAIWPGDRQDLMESDEFPA